MNNRNLEYDRELEFDNVCHSLDCDADFVACAPKELIDRNKAWLIEAREKLNDALARVGA